MGMPRRIKLTTNRSVDEFERRYPGGFAAWLTSGAGTLDYLTPYAARGHFDHATINWDELTRGRD